MGLHQTGTHHVQMFSRQDAGKGDDQSKRSVNECGIVLCGIAGFPTVARAKPFYRQLTPGCCFICLWKLSVRVNPLVAYLQV
jgi:hypothetical protein